jgi:hypothetical protein
LSEGSEQRRTGGRLAGRWLFVIAGSLVAAIALVAVVMSGSASLPPRHGPIRRVIVGGPVPVISGIAREGQTLTAALSGFRRRQAVVLTKWVRCAPSGAACRAIPQATALTYRLTMADVGSRIRFEDVGVTTRPGYGKPALSVTTAPVTGSASSRFRPPLGSEAASQDTATFAETIAAWDLRERTSASLLRQLPLRRPGGLRARLLRDGHASVQFTVPTGGWLSVRYSVPPGEYERAPGPAILAGRATFRRAGTQAVRLALTPAGRQRLKHRQLEVAGWAMFRLRGHLGYYTEATD